MISLSDIVFGVLVPIVLSGILLFFAFPLWNNNQTRPTLVAVALCLATAAGFLGLRGLPSFPPADSTDWLFTIEIFALPFAVFFFKEKEEGAGLSFLILLFGTIVTILMIYPLFESAYDLSSGLVHTLASIAGFYAFWRGMLFYRAKASARELVFLMIVLATLGSALLVFSGSLSLGQLAGALAASIGPLLVLSVLRASIFVCASAIAVFSILFFAHLLQGYHYADMPRSSALLLAISPMAGVLAAAGPAERQKRLAIATLIAVVAIGIAGYQYA